MGRVRRGRGMMRGRCSADAVRWEVARQAVIEMGQAASAGVSELIKRMIFDRRKRGEEKARNGRMYVCFKNNLTELIKRRRKRFVGI